MFRSTHGALRVLLPISVAVTALAACGGSGHSNSDVSKLSPIPSPTSSPSGDASSQSLTKATATTIVSRAVLGNEDLGPTWSGSLIYGGSTLDDPTLTLCDESFPSDDLRLARNQTELYSKTAAVSNEVVGYRAGGAKQALAEMAAAAKACNGKSATNDDGDTYRFTEEILPPHSSWGTGALAIRETGTNVADPSDTYSSMMVFQVQGDVLTAVYEWEGNVTQDLLFSVADLAAKRLTQAVANAPRSTASIPVPTGAPITPPDEYPTDEGDPSDPGRLA